MDQKNQFKFVIDSLKKHEYPHINTMSEDKWPDIFGKGNRMFLVSWFLKKIDDKFAQFAEGATEQKLGDILNSQGLCTSVEKYTFMSCEMQNVDQIKILYRMFKLLDDIKENTTITYDAVSNEEFKYYMDLNINLFPEYGAKSSITPEQRRTKISEYKKEIEKLKELDNGNPSKQDININDIKHQLQQEVHNLELTYPGFKRKLHDILAQTQYKSLNADFVFKENFSKVIEICASESKILLEYIQGLHSIMDFTRNDYTKIVEHDGRHVAYLQEISELCDEISSQKKH